jgi:predicted secreted acid phosphatase
MLTRLLALLIASGCAATVAPKPVVPPSPPAAEAPHSSGVQLPSGTFIPNLATVKGEIVRYHDSGQWAAAISKITEQARTRLDELIPSARRPALVLDVDDTALSTYALQRRLLFGFVESEWERWMEDQSPPANRGVLKLFNHARSRGVAIFFVTGRREHSREATERQLRSAGYSGWTGVVLKPEAFENPSVVMFKSAARAQIEAKGYEILVNVGDQWSDLDGGHSIASYKLPNPIYLIP